MVFILQTGQDVIEGYQRHDAARRNRSAATETLGTPGGQEML